MKGVVKRFDDVKGFGFIEVPEGKDVFVHFSGIMGDGRKTLNPGDEVLFDVVDGPKGKNAINVKVTFGAYD